MNNGVIISGNNPIKFSQCRFSNSCFKKQPSGWAKRFIKRHKYGEL